MKTHYSSSYRICIPIRAGFAWGRKREEKDDERKNMLSNKGWFGNGGKFSRGRKREWGRKREEKDDRRMGNLAGEGREKRRTTGLQEEEA